MLRQPDEDLWLSEKRDLLENGMANLPDSYRKAIALHYLRGRSYLEITRELNVPLGTWKVWLFRARTKLRKEFENSGLGTHLL
jgi:RNA polymerase sigma-70 factor (ECF subfamily)